MSDKPTSTLTQKQYSILVNLYNEMTDEFWLLSHKTQDEFFDVLFGIKEIKQGD